VRRAEGRKIRRWRRQKGKRWKRDDGRGTTEIGGNNPEPKTLNLEPRGQRSPVKSASLVFYEEFNRASRGQTSEVGGQHPAP